VAQGDDEDKQEMNNKTSTRREGVGGGGVGQARQRAKVQNIHKVVRRRSFVRVVRPFALFFFLHFLSMVAL
jgi:hypothetical protein